MNTPSESIHAPVPIRTDAAAARSFGRTAHWTVGVAAALLVLISVGGYFYHREQLNALAAEHLRLIVTGPASLRRGTAAEYLVSTTALDGRPLAASIEAAILGPDGQRLKAYKEPVDERGRMLVDIPADMKLPDQVTLRVAAHHGQSREEAELPLHVATALHTVRLSLNQPWYRPGETVFFRATTHAPAAPSADAPQTARFEIVGPAGTALPQASLDAAFERGVAAGSLAIPSGASDGRYAIAVRSADRRFSEQRAPFLVRRDGLLRDDEAGGGENASGKIEVAFYPEGGGLAAGLENRVYFTARNSQGVPIELGGAIAADNGDGRSGEEIVSVRTTFCGLGSFHFTPRVGASYRLRIARPSGVSDEPVLPKASADRKALLTTGAGVFAAQGPVEFNVRASKAGLPLVVAARCDDVQVGQQPLVTRLSPSGANPVAIALNGEAGGVLRLTVYDYSRSPPAAVAERFVYRRLASDLRIDAKPDKPQYAPGEEATIAVSVIDQKGLPASAVLGAAVFDESLLDPSLLAYGVMTPTNTENAELLLSASGKSDASAATALDLWLGTQKPQPPGDQPPAVSDNLPRIRADYEKVLADYQAGRTRALNTLTVGSFFGGLGLVLLAAMLGFLGIVSGIRLWVAALGATTCCLIVGAVLMDPSRLATGLDTAVSFVSYSAPAARPGDAALDPLPLKDAPKNAERSAEPDAVQTGSPDAPYWNPRLAVGADGKTTFRFRLPERPGRFYVKLDAQSDGRFGFGWAEIVVGEGK